MPIYEYECGACGHRLETLQALSDRPLRKCPECGKPKLRRLISPPVFRLKGSGWYETDFKSDKESRRNLAEGHKDEAAADTKPADAAAKPAADTQASEPKAAESKAAESKPAESKPPPSRPTAPSRPSRRVSVGRKPARKGKH
jgi:putative FmdB family regulatory protein